MCKGPEACPKKGRKLKHGDEVGEGAGQETELVIHGTSFLSVLHFVGRAKGTRAALHF